ncbi:MAG: hypothetical protein R3F31_02405 [Verrucomicrobiales bacterium]
MAPFSRYIRLDSLNLLHLLPSWQLILQPALTFPLLLFGWVQQVKENQIVRKRLDLGIVPVEPLSLLGYESDHDA